LEGALSDETARLAENVMRCRRMAETCGDAEIAAELRRMAADLEEQWKCARLRLGKPIGWKPSRLSQG